MNTELHELEDGANLLGIRLSDSMIKKFKIYHNELLKWCDKINLVSERDRARIVKRHFLDSLSAAEFISHKAYVLDIGSGAGFPGIPIKIARPDIELDILEPRLKRFEFLNHLIKAIELEVKIYRDRGEEFKLKTKSLGCRQPDCHQACLAVRQADYDVILSRSVGNLKWLTDVSADILARDGKIVTYKGSRFSDEFKEIHGWKLLHRKQREFVTGTIVVLGAGERDEKSAGGGSASS